MPDIKIAVFKADSPAPSVMKAAGGDYGHLFANLFKDAAAEYNSSETAKLFITTTAFDVVNKGEYPEKLEGVFDAIVITGSASSANDDKPWIHRLSEYIVDVNTHHPTIKFVGICFGHQIIARALGGTVQKNERGWEVGWTDTDVTEDGKKYFGSEKPNLRIMSMHQDHVVEVPPGFSVLATTELSRNQVLVRNGTAGQSPVMSIQGHPEYTADIVSAFVDIRQERGIFSDEFVRSVKDVIHKDVDGKWFTQIILKFLLQK